MVKNTKRAFLFALLLVEMTVETVEVARFEFTSGESQGVRRDGRKLAFAQTDERMPRGVSSKARRERSSPTSLAIR